MTASSAGAARFRAARDLLLEHRAAPEGACGAFRWPELGEFNWALDFFDGIEPRDRAALRIVGENGADRQVSFSELSARSNRVANHLRAEGIGRGDAVLVMLGNDLQLWESILGAIKVGAVLVPTSTLCTPADLAERVERSGAKAVIADAACAERFSEAEGAPVRLSVGGAPPGWADFAAVESASVEFAPSEATTAHDPLLYYFTSGTTARPKLVEHTYASYPVGHLSTMFWIGVRPGDAHLNVSSPGWAKHAWSSVFAPWNAEATVVAASYSRFDAATLLEVVGRVGVTTFCAPPTVWRMLIQEDLSKWPVAVREAVSAGEPLNPEVIDEVARHWGITVRDGYGQTETTALIGNPPGAKVKSGSMGRELPGYTVVLLDPLDGAAGDEGELCIPEDPRPLGLMAGYRDGVGIAPTPGDGYHHTGDIVRRDEEGYLTFVGRADDVFKASDYRISPFELESVLIEHEAVAEAAVVPAPDPIRLAVPKAYVVLAASYEPTPETARSVLAHCRERLAPYKRVRRIEFSELPKTISGKIRRVELRNAEQTRSAKGALEFYEEDFPDLRSG